MKVQPGRDQDRQRACERLAEAAAVYCQTFVPGNEGQRGAADEAYRAAERAYWGVPTTAATGVAE